MDYSTLYQGSYSNQKLPIKINGDNPYGIEIVARKKIDHADESDDLINFDITPNSAHSLLASRISKS